MAADRPAGAMTRWNTRSAVLVPAPEEPVTPTMGWCRDIAGRLDAPVLQIKDLVAEALAADLEFRLQARRRARHEPAVLGFVAQRRLRVEHVDHVLGVVRPVRRQLQHAAALQAARDQRRERGLDQAALVMAGLVPGI